MIGRKIGELIDAIISTIEKYKTNPILYAMLFLVIIIYFALYNIPRNKRAMKRNVISIVSYAFKVLLGFVNDILTAIESITNFIDVVRVILKGKLTEGVQFLLSNYAIIALSAASFVTTYSGMHLITNGYIATLVTFGIQVGILSLSSKIAIESKRNKKDNRKIKAYKDIAYHKNRQNLDNVLTDEKKTVKYNSPDNYLQHLLNQEYDNWYDDKRPFVFFIGYSFLLAFSMIASIYFSYVYFFDLAIRPNVPIENYISSINIITELTDSYSQDIASVNDILTRNLQELNQKTRKNLDTSDVDVVDSEIENLKEQVEEKKAELEKKEEEYESLPDRRNRDKQIVYAEIQDLEDEVKDLEREEKQIIGDSKSDPEYLKVKNVLNSLDTLDLFYASPLSAMDGKNWESNVKESFETVLQCNSETGDKDGEEKNSDNDNSRLNTIFSNYLALCKYYKQQGYMGMAHDTMEDALKEENTILEEYSAELDKSRDFEGDEKTKAEESAAVILNNESSRILQNMIKSLNNVPSISLWDGMENDERSGVNNLAKEEIFSKLYKLYRISTGRVNILEMVVLKFSMKYTVLSALLLFLAMFVDVLTVILTLTKSASEFENRLPRYRKLLYKMFINDILSEQEKQRTRLWRGVGGAGVAVGLILFLVYFNISADGKGNLHLAVALVCFVCFFGVVSYILLRLYEKSHRNVSEWRNESLYNSLKGMWNLPSQDPVNAQSLRSRISQVSGEGNNITLTPGEMQQIVDLLSSEDEDEYVKFLKPAARILFRNIQMMELNRRTLEYSLRYPGLSSERIYMQGWYDKIGFPCISVQAVRDVGMILPFSVLKSEGLVSYVEIEEDDPHGDGHAEETPNGDNARTRLVQYYVLSDKFLRILYDLIIQAGSGSEIEDDTNLLDDLSDIYEENDMKGE